MSLFDALISAVPNDRAQDIAISAPDAEPTWDGLVAASEGAAALLIEAGVQPGDRVAYLGWNSAAEVALLFACARVEAIMSPFNWRLAEEELAWQVADSEPKLIVADAEHMDRARKIGGDRRVLEAASLLDAPPVAVAGHQAAQGDAAVLLVYTSGATGRPKGAVLTQHALLANARLSWDMHDMTADDHVLTGLPLFHVGGLNIQTLPALLRGARVTLMDRFEPGACLATIRNARPTLTVQVPTTFQALMAHPDWENTNLSSLRAIATGSTDVPVKLIEAVHARGVPVIQIYGATETGPVVVYQKIDHARSKIGSIGRPGPGVEIKISGPNEEALSDGQNGEIWVRSPSLASEYWQNPSASEALEGGWFRTGDVARRGEDGFLWFADRIKNVIISGGENIYPAELERVLAEIPGVKEAAVVGRPDPKWGAAPVAVVVPGVTLSKADILASFEGRIARFKHPKDVVFLDALPRNAMGKVVIEELRELVCQ